eukprot:717583-Pelagomonas_calceolata.AAC.10
MLCRAYLLDEASKPGDDGQSEMSAGDGGTEIDGQSVASGCSVSVAVRLVVVATTQRMWQAAVQ